MRRPLLPFLFIFISTGILLAACSNFGGKSACPLGHISTPLGDCIKDPQCDTTDECLNHGRCTWAGEFCVATTGQDCRNSYFCTQKGECVYAENQGLSSGKCVASDADCRASDICRTLGKCSAGRKGFCVPRSDEDCAQSEACTQSNRCTLQDVRNAQGRRTGVQACQL